VFQNFKLIDGLKRICPAHCARHIREIAAPDRMEPKQYNLYIRQRCLENGKVEKVFALELPVAICSHIPDMGEQTMLYALFGIAIGGYSSPTYSVLG